MNPQEKTLFLEHISTCNYCAEQFAEGMLDESFTAPADMKANILAAVRRPEIQIAKKINETSKQMQLLLYSLKVGAATLGALAVLIFAMNFNNNMVNSGPETTDIPKKSTEDNEDKFSLTLAIRDNMNHLSSNILDFSNTIIKTEVKEDD
jgi:hypothetical protein